MRVAVIGSGIAGAVAAAALRSRLGERCELAVVEREARVGGRVHDREIAGVRVETGATLYHSSNRLLAGFVAELGLSAIDVSAERQTLGIWDGRAFVVRTTGSARADAARTLLRYGLSLPRAARVVRRMVSRLEAVYPELAAGRAWQSPDQLLDALGLRQPCAERAGDFLRGRGVSQRFVDEFADGVSRNNYGQEAPGLNAFVNLVSLAGAGLGGGRLHRVREGNAQVCARLVERAGAELRLTAEVSRLGRRDGGWTVELANGDQIAAEAVVLAAPLELAAIDLGAEVALPPRRAYKTIHATFVAGRLAGRAFGREPAPDFVLTTAGAGALLSVQRVAAEAEGGALYKIFSLDRAHDDLLDRLFDPVAHVERVAWRAYPELPPQEPWAPFALAPGLYYPSAMEYAVSTMETQAIAATAVANLVSEEAGR